MTNPLNRNKVIRFIKDYPHESSFSLINTDKSIIVRPGDPGETGTNSGDIIPDSNIPGCSVGLFGREGNPVDFNTIIDWWLDNNQRYKLNPIALMRLWASLYRTYFGYVKITSRVYPGPNSALVIRSRRVDPATDYSVEFEDGAGNISVWDATTGQFSGGFVKGLLEFSALYETEPPTEQTLPIPIRSVQTITGTFVEAQGIKPNVGGAEYNEVITEAINKNILIKGLTGKPITVPRQGSTGTISNIGMTHTDPVLVKRRIRRAPEQDTNGAKTYYYDEVETPYSLIARTNQGPYRLTITFTSPTSIDRIFYRGDNSSFRLSTSVDGTNFDEVLNFDNYNGITESFTGVVRTTSTPSTIYSNLPTLTIGSTFTTGTTFNITKNGTPTTAIITASQPYNYDVNKQLTDGHLGFLNRYNNSDRTWQLKEVGTNTTIQSGQFDYEIFSPNRLVRVLVLEYGDTTLGYGHPIIDGFISNPTPTTKTNFKAYSQIDFTEQYYTDNNPENYTIGSTQIIDNLAFNAYQTTTLDNVQKWKYLPLTLPFNSPTLRNDLNRISILLNNLDPEFEYTEDYASNRLIRLPNSPAEWSEHLTLSQQLRRNPVLYWHNLRFSEVLNDLINYCRTTCLKFWRIDPSLSVFNYKDYTENVLDIEPETRDIRDLTGVSAGAGRVNPVAIQTFSLIEGTADIETSSARDLWFLSGGGYTNVNLPSNILSEYIDTLIAEGQTP